MKRGPVTVIDRVPGTEFGSRIATLQRALSASGCDWAIIYADDRASGDVQYLTGFCLYTGECLLLVPRVGSPRLVTRLPARINDWVRATSFISEIRNGPELIRNVAADIRLQFPPKVGVVDIDRWPGALLEELVRSIGARPVDLQALVRSMRCVPSDGEVAAARRGAALAAEAIAAARACTETREQVAAADRCARDLGAEDVRVASAELGSGRSIEVVVQYADMWSVAAAPLNGDARAQVEMAAAWTVLEAHLHAGVAMNSLVNPLRRDSSTLNDWRLRVAQQCDLETHRHRAIAPSDEALEDGNVIGVTLINTSASDGLWSARMYRIGGTESQCLAIV